MQVQRIIEFLKALKAPSEYLAAYFPEKETPTERLCTTCAHVGIPIRQMAGRADVERGLWAVLIALAVIYAIDSVVLNFTSFFAFQWLYKLTSMAGKVFAVCSIAYTAIRISIRSNSCPKCGGAQVIPLDTPPGERHSARRETGDFRRQTRTTDLRP